MDRLDFHIRYQPVTAHPYTVDDSYIQVPASTLLQPYVRCFWGSVHNFNPHDSRAYDGVLLIPDTCSDLIMIQNHDSGLIRMLFVGLNDTYTVDAWDVQEKNISVFAIRFHSWAMNLISRVPMKDTLNQAVAPDDFFPGVREMGERIFEIKDFRIRMLAAEEYVKSLIHSGQVCLPFFDGIDFILKHKGVSTLKGLAEHLCYSERQTQRIFMKSLGITPGYYMDLVRYQSVWQEMLTARITDRKIDYIDLVARYGYADQSHFIANFKKYHSMTPGDALNNL